MELFIFRQNDYNRLYNCSFYDVDEIPLERRTNIIIGCALFLLGIFFELLYVPCICSLWRRLNSNNAYKFMFFIGVVDMTSIVISGPITGYFTTQGYVFCSLPTFIYVTGSLAFSLWIVQSTASVMLAINRCVELSSPNLADTFYRGKRLWLWLLMPTFYALFIYIFTSPPLFSGLEAAWFFNPHFGYYDDFGLTYYNKAQFMHNPSTVLFLVGIYVIFLINLRVKSADAKGPSSFNKTSFLQVLLINILNAATALIYIVMQFVPIGKTLIIISSFSWLGTSGIPALIYITINSTIRSDCKRMLMKTIGRKVSYTKATRSNYSNGRPTLYGNRIGPIVV